MCPDKSGDSCEVRGAPDLSGVDQVRLADVADHAAALASEGAGRRLGEAMLLSWYDRDRDLEAPAHVSECHQDAAVPGYVDYALSRGASLQIDVGNGRFIFFYRGVAD